MQLVKSEATAPFLWGRFFFGQPVAVAGADPNASPPVFDPKKLVCKQWALAARSANMSYGCLTTRHHSGFCIWDTKTTDYNVMHSCRIAHNDYI